MLKQKLSKSSFFHLIFFACFSQTFFPRSKLIQGFQSKLRLNRFKTIKQGLLNGGDLKIFGDFNILKLTLDILELQMKSKKKVLGLQFLSSLVGGGNSLFYFVKRGKLKNSLRNLALKFEAILTRNYQRTLFALFRILVN